MTNTDKLEPGWYWVRWQGAGGAWVPAEWTLGAWWSATAECAVYENTPAIIGPRLTPPTEKE